MTNREKDMQCDREGERERERERERESERVIQGKRGRENQIQRSRANKDNYKEGGWKVTDTDR